MQDEILERRELQRKSSENTHRVNESLLNIKIYMERVKLHLAGQRMTQEL